MDINQQAASTIETLRNKFALNSFQFSMDCSMYLSGDAKKPLRQEIIFALTQQRRPVSKCSVAAVENVLKSSFQQYNLF